MNDLSPASFDAHSSRSALAVEEEDQGTLAGIVVEPERRKGFARILRPTIAQRVVLVGAIPIALFAIAGLIAVILLNRADVARGGALDAATIYRQVVSGMSAQDAYVTGAAGDRNRQAAAFSASTTGAAKGLESLAVHTSDPAQNAAVAQTLATLDRYRTLMGRLTVSTAQNDRLLAAMDQRLETLLRLTDEARSRQNRSNQDLVATLQHRDATLKLTRDIVDTALALRAAVADGMLTTMSGRSSAEASVSSSFETARVRNAVAALREAMDRSTEAGEAVEPMPALDTGDVSTNRRLLDWLDRLLKVQITAQRSLQTEIADLLAYTIGAHETEQATQNIAVDTLKLGRSSRDGTSGRAGTAIPGILAQSTAIGEKISSLPIAPLIQSEMLDAMDAWREGLRAVQEGLAGQAALLTEMSDTAGIMLLQVSSLNNDLSRHADAIGATVRKIMLVGGTAAFLLASAAGLLVARSITRPLTRLEQGMIDRAGHADAGLMPDAHRRDEIGSMARATNRFLIEIDKREGALRRAKEHSDETLRRLQDTQAELVQAGKLASLGQLVAGVAHEINTPLGVALTTATVMAGDVKAFEAETRDGRVTQAAFHGFVSRMQEGARLTAANLERAAGLVHAFKQVAADQASGERREFELADFMNDLFTSLGPLRKRAGHQLDVVCEPGLHLDSYPGALAQVLTNLLSNTYAHAFEPGRNGHIKVTAERRKSRSVRILFADDGRGIAAADQARVFDPFFTTGRGSGSTGLGLPIVFNLVTATLGGSIALRSSPGRGSCFVLDLPLEAPFATNTTEAANP